MAMHDMHRLIPVIFLLLAPLANAGDAALLRGIGTSTCGEYSEYRKQGAGLQTDVFFVWAMGFMSGQNWQDSFDRAPQAEPPTGPTILAYLDKFCSQEPLKLVAAGVAEMRKDLLPHGRQGNIRP